MEFRRNAFIRFFVLCLMLLCSWRVRAQVLPQDSLALVALYNSTNGPSWSDHTNWLVTRVGLWEGVAIVGNRVQTLALPNHYLVGTLPDAFCDLTGLEYIYLQNNQLSGELPACIGNAVSINSIDISHNAFTGAFPAAFATNMPALADVWISHNQFTDFPDLSSVPELSNLSVDNNRLTFEDLLPNASIPNVNYSYTPQDDLIQSGADVILQVFDPFDLSVTVAGSGNEYQWRSNEVPLADNGRISGTRTDHVYNSSAEVADGGFYTCMVTNPALPLLTIQVASSRVQVTDNRLLQTYGFSTDTSMFCGTTAFILPDSTNFLPVSYALVSPSTALLQNDREFLPQALGTYAIRIYNNGDANRLPFEDTLRMAVLPQQVLPVFSIVHDLPVYEGEELELSVAYVPGLDYTWTIPSHPPIDSSALYLPALTAAEQGVYTVRITHNGCFYDSLSITVRLAVDSSIVIYELITPNGDGSNETFYIDNLDWAPPMQVTVFNVWNEVVYHQDNYENDWDGGGLPVGTYYYLVKVAGWNKTYKGSLYIKR